jgi:hypothetical protein
MSQLKYTKKRKMEMTTWGVMNDDVRVSNLKKYIKNC